MNLPSAMLLCPDHTARPVDARWQRVIDLADRGQGANHRWDDEPVRRGLAYLRRLRKCRTDANRQRLAEAMPDIDAAYRLHGTPNKLTRAIVEARLLAGQSIEEVAAACGLTLAAVTTYETLFFQVLGRLDATSFIMNCALGPKLLDQLDEDDFDVVLKHCAFRKGPILLEALLPYFLTDWSLPLPIETASDDDLGRLGEMLSTRALVLAYVLPVGKCGEPLPVAGRAAALAKEIRTYVTTREHAAEPTRHVRAHPVLGSWMPSIGPVDLARALAATSQLQNTEREDSILTLAAAA